MKRLIVLLACAMTLCSLAGCRNSDGKSDDSSSVQETTGKKSHFVIEEVSD